MSQLIHFPVFLLWTQPIRDADSRFLSPHVPLNRQRVSKSIVTKTCSRIIQLQSASCGGRTTTCLPPRRPNLGNGLFSGAQFAVKLSLA